VKSRDDLEAAHQRIAQLEEEVKELREHEATARAEPPPPEPVPDAEPESKAGPPSEDSQPPLSRRFWPLLPLIVAVPSYLIGYGAELPPDPFAGKNVELPWALVLTAVASTLYLGDAALHYHHGRRTSAGRLLFVLAVVVALPLLLPLAMLAMEAGTFLLGIGAALVGLWGLVSWIRGKSA
jgi:hypothetical protein